MVGRKIGKRAVVIGAGMAGLAAAGAVADYFERVIVLERGLLPNQAVPRPGTPQSRHLHVSLPGGVQPPSPGRVLCAPASSVRRSCVVVEVRGAPP